jgi:hypothetical protein
MKMAVQMTTVKDDIKKTVFDIPAGFSTLVKGKEVIIA